MFCRRFVRVVDTFGLIFGLGGWHPPWTLLNFSVMFSLLADSFDTQLIRSGHSKRFRHFRCSGAVLRTRVTIVGSLMVIVWYGLPLSVAGADCTESLFALSISAGMRMVIGVNFSPADVGGDRSLSLTGGRHWACLVSTSIRCGVFSLSRSRTFVSEVFGISPALSPCADGLRACGLLLRAVMGGPSNVVVLLPVNGQPSSLGVALMTSGVFLCRRQPSCRIYGSRVFYGGRRRAVGYCSFLTWLRSSECVYVQVFGLAVHFGWRGSRFGFHGWTIRGFCSFSSVGVAPGRSYAIVCGGPASASLGCCVCRRDPSCRSRECWDVFACRAGLAVDGRVQVRSTTRRDQAPAGAEGSLAGCGCVESVLSGSSFGAAGGPTGCGGVLAGGTAVILPMARRTVA